MRNLDDFLTLLKNVKRTSPNKIMACCPAHNDGQGKGHQSLSIKVVDDKILLKCFAGCTTQDIVKTLGLTMSDLFLGEKKEKPKQASSSDKTIEKVYPYHDAAGKLLFEVVRYKPKSFTQRRPGANGKYIYNIRGCERVIYRLPQIIAAIKHGDTIYHCEGEKDAESLVSLGLESTTSPMGAGSWKSSQAKYYAGAKQVVIIPDQDQQGILYSREVAGDIRSLVKSVKIIDIPGPGAKDITDWLSAGHNREQLAQLVDLAPEWIPSKNGKDIIDLAATNKLLKESSNGQYRIIDGKFHRVVTTKEREEIELPLCNFVARISDDLYKDNGNSVTRFLSIQGRQNGTILPTITIPEAQFDSLKWPRREWGFKAQIEQSRANTDHLINAINKASGDVPVRTIYTHTGWRKIDDKMVYLTSGGAIGLPDIEVELPPRLSKYKLPQPSGNPKEAVQKSLDMIMIARQNVTIPAFIAPYLSVLNVFEDMDFTIWYLGRSGSLKSVMTALSLSHFGDFTHKSLPTNWFGTPTELEKLSFLAKDTIFVIDDYAPPVDSTGAREVNKKVEYMIRAFGNRQGKVRSHADMTSQETYYPRGLLITSGEQLPPPGVSRSARILPVYITLDDFCAGGNDDYYLLTQAQKDRFIYPLAMAHFIKWIQDNWEPVKKTFTGNVEKYTVEIPKRGAHLRLIEAVSLMQAGLDIISEFAVYSGALKDSETKALVDTGRLVLHGLLYSQSSNIKGERPGQRFIDVLKSLLSSGKVIFRNQSASFDWTPDQAGPGQTIIGWDTRSDVIYLNPPEAYSVVHQHCRRIDEYFGTHKDETWRDLLDLNLLYGIEKDDSPTIVKSFNGVKIRVLPVAREVIYPSEALSHD